MRKLFWIADAGWSKWTTVVLAVCLAASLTDVYIGTEYTLQALGKDRRDIYGALLTAFGTFLGISYAVTAMVISFADRPSLSVYAQGKNYPDIASMMRRANAGLAASAALSFAAMVVTELVAEPWVLAVLTASAMYSFAVLGVAMNRFTTMLERVAQAHHEKALDEFNKDREKFSGGSRSQGPAPADDNCDKTASAGPR